MKILLNKLQRLLPSSDLDRALLLPHRLSPSGVLGAGNDTQGLDLRGATLDGQDLSGVTLFAPLLEGARLSGLDLSEAKISHARLAGARLAECDLGEARLEIVDAEGLDLRACTLAGAHLTGVAMSRAHLEDVDLTGACLTLSDAFAGEWRRVDASGIHLRGVDLSFTHFHQVNLTGADLRGCTLAWCTFDGLQLDDARLEGVDLRGATGLSAEQRDLARQQGARLTAGWLEGLVVRLIHTLAPTVNPETAERAARGVGIMLQVGAVLGAVALTLALFRDRVVPRVDDAAADGEAPSLVRKPTDKEVAQTRQSLQRLREAIQAAYETSGRYGVASWPSIDDLADNVFDRDGAGPGTERVPLVEGGLPANLLTMGEAVLPYCNDVASQETLSGDDSDWHYCEETGRIYACGGFTDQATLDW